MEQEPSIGYIYVVATPEFWKTGQTVYKVGRSVDVRARAYGYPKNSFNVYARHTWD